MLLLLVSQSHPCHLPRIPEQEFCARVLQQGHPAPLLSQGRQKCPKTPNFLVLVLLWWWSGSAPVVSSMLVVVLRAQRASGPPVVPRGLGTQKGQRCLGANLRQGAGHGALPARCSSSSHTQPSPAAPAPTWGLRPQHPQRTRASSPQPLLLQPL